MIRVPGKVPIEVNMKNGILDRAVKKFMQIDWTLWGGAFAFNAFFSLFPMILLITIVLVFNVTNAVAGVNASGSAGGLSGARVTLWDASLIVREEKASGNGNFVFTGVAPGVYTLIAYKGGYYPGSMQITISDKNLNDIEISMSLIPTINLTSFLMRIHGTAEIDHAGDGTLEAVSPGDVITAESPQGILCGQYTVILAGSYGDMTIYGDDPLTAALNKGCVNGDNVILFINGIHTSGNFCYSNLGISEENFSAAVGAAKTIRLKSGWNLVTLGLIPYFGSMPATQEQSNTALDSSCGNTAVTGEVKYIMGLYRIPTAGEKGGVRLFKKNHLLSFRKRNLVMTLHF